MGNQPLRILQVSTYDRWGGAAKIGWDLFQWYRKRGHGSWLAVGHQYTDEPGVLLIPNEKLLQGRWFRFCHGLHNRIGGWLERGWPLSMRLQRWLEQVARLAAELALPGKWWDRKHGYEDFRAPGTWRLLKLAPQQPDVIHCHNLHHDYFDLRALPWLSRQAPLVLSLHDSWLLGGLCGAPLDCERWRTGCGECPLREPIYELPRDATASNWRRKRRIYARSRLHIVTACRWLMERVGQSILAPGVVKSRVIPTGVDMSLFRPGDRLAARAKLGIPPDVKVFLFVGQFVRANWAKDYQTIRDAVDVFARRQPDQRVLFIARGEEALAEYVGKAEVRFLPFEKDFREGIPYYHAADLYLHAAHMDTFPNVVLEALACGTPVVATGVGGIPEQVKSVDLGISGWPWKTHGVDEATGVLVPRKDPEGLATAIERLVHDEPLCRRLGENAAHHARARFDIERMVDDHLEWYAELIEEARAQRPATAAARP